MKQPDDVLAIEKVSFVFSTSRILDSIDLRIAAGERVAVVGESGSGKGVLARVATGMVVPNTGQVTLFGTLLADLPLDALRNLRTRCGLAWQGGSLISSLDVDDNLRLAFSGASRPAASRVQRRIDRLTLDFGIEHSGGRPVGSLATGEQRRVELARAFVRDPEFVLLDEPFEGARATAVALEAAVRRQVVGRRRAMLLLTQDEPLAYRLATRVLHLVRGRLVQQVVPLSAPEEKS